MEHLGAKMLSCFHRALTGKFVVKTHTGTFNAVSPDMKLEQSIQRSKKGSGGIIGQTKQQSYITDSVAKELCLVPLRKVT